MLDLPATLHIVESELKRRELLQTKLSDTNHTLTETGVLPLSHVWSRILSRGNHPPEAPGWLRFLAMRQAADLAPTVQDEQNPFVRTARPELLVQRLLHIHRVLGMARVQPDELEEAIQSVSDHLSPALSGLPEVFRRYRLTLHEDGFRDRPELLELLLSNLEEMDGLPSPFSHVEHVEVHGLAHVPELEFQVLTEFLQNAESARVEFRYHPEREEAFRWVLPTLTKFEWEGMELEQVDPGFQYTTSDPTNTLDEITRYIFRDPEEIMDLDPIENDGSVHFICTGTPEEETERIAKRVRDRIDQGQNPSHLAVVARGSEEDNERIHSTFREHDIPVFYRDTDVSSYNPGVLTMFHLLQTVQNAYPSDGLFEILQNQLLQGPTGVASPHFETIIQEAGITGGPPEAWMSNLERLKTTLQRRLEAHREKHPDSNVFPTDEVYDQQLAEALESVISQLDPLFEFLSTLEEQSSLQDLTERLLAVEGTVDLREALLDKTPEHREEDRLFRTISMFRKFLHELFTGLRTTSIDDRFVEGQYDTSLLKHLWEQFVQTQKSWLGPPDGVRVLNDPRELIGCEFNYVFLMRANEGTWPQPVFDDPFLQESLIETLRSRNERPILQTTGQKRARELFLFYQVLSSAQDGLVCSWHETDDQGKEQLPSPYLEDIRNLICEDRFTDDRTSPGKKEDSFESSSDRDRIISLTRTLFDGQDLDIEGDAVQSDTQIDSSLEHRIRRIFERARLDWRRNQFFMETDPERRRTQSGPWSGTLDDPDSFREYITQSSSNKFSPTALERYAQCPYAYYSERVLELEETDRTVLGMNRKREGILLHEIFRKLYSDQDPSESLTDRDVSRVCQDVFDLWEHYGFQGDPAFWQVTRKRLFLRVQRTVRFLERTRGDTGILTEQAFGQGRAMPSVQMGQGDERKIYFEGRIDRLEVDEDEVPSAILDYKNARGRQSYRNALKPVEFGKRSFQMPIYILAATEAVQNPAKQLTGFEAGFVTLREETGEPLVTKNIPETEEEAKEWIEQLQAETEEGARRIIREIRSGNFEVTPDPCLRGCPYRDMCRYVDIAREKESG